MEEFRELSRELTKVLDKKHKKDNGVFFSPRSYRQKLWNIVKANVSSTPSKVLEPSFGAGEFIFDALEIYPNVIIEGVELNKQLYDAVSTDIGQQYKNIKLHQKDFLEFTTDTKYQLIIGNPPYVVIKNIPNEYRHVMTGRPNLYCCFLYKCINMLDNDGILAFVLPKSILNTSYYDKLRHYICQQCCILDIIEMDEGTSKFKDTQQATVGLVLQKCSKSNNDAHFVVHKNDKVLFSPYYKDIQAYMSNPCLHDLGIQVKTGSIVWNQVKKTLTNNPKEGKLLLYMSNMKDGKFVPLATKDADKKQFCKTNKPLIYGPVILMNRGYGNTTYKPSMLFVENVIDYEGYKDGFLAENHVNVLYPYNEQGKSIIKNVYDYLQSETCMKFIQMYSGNGAMSKTEIETMLPIILS
jgi:adenine-specific DNA-methyltransferase